MLSGVLRRGTSTTEGFGALRRGNGGRQDFAPELAAQHRCCLAGPLEPCECAVVSSSALGNAAPTDPLLEAVAALSDLEPARRASGHPSRRPTRMGSRIPAHPASRRRRDFVATPPSWSGYSPVQDYSETKQPQPDPEPTPLSQRADCDAV